MEQATKDQNARLDHKLRFLTLVKFPLMARNVSSRRGSPPAAIGAFRKSYVRREPFSGWPQADVQRRFLECPVGL